MRKSPSAQTQNRWGRTVNPPLHNHRHRSCPQTHGKTSAMSDPFTDQIFQDSVGSWAGTSVPLMEGDEVVTTSEKWAKTKKGLDGFPPRPP